MIDAILLSAKNRAWDGLRDGTLKIVGSVVRFASGEHKGEIHSHLQQTAASEFAQQTTMSLDGLKQGQQAMQSMLGNISGGVQMLQVLSGLNLALSVADIGISVVGFALMNAKLNAVQGAIQEVSSGIQMIQMDAIERDFTKLRAQAERYENTWHLNDYQRSVPLLLDIANNANETQLLLESHAKKLLHNGLDMLPSADRMLDGMALTIGLRVSAAMAANEGRLARHIADDGARKIEAMTGAIGQIDLVHARLPKGIDAASVEWDAAFAKARDDTTPLIAKLRTREANAATRSSPLPVLEAKGVTPREWLATARSEQKEPILFLAGQSI
jgi:hypothetical protein